jgi:hypothetical protein
MEVAEEPVPDQADLPRVSTRHSKMDIGRARSAGVKPSSRSRTRVISHPEGVGEPDLAAGGAEVVAAKAADPLLELRRVLPLHRVEELPDLASQVAIQVGGNDLGRIVAGPDVDPDLVADVVGHEEPASAAIALKGAHFGVPEIQSG